MRDAAFTCAHRRLPCDRIAARYGFQTASTAAVTADAAILAGRCMTNHAGRALGASMQTAVAYQSGADRASELHEQHVRRAGFRYQFAHRHHLNAATNEDGRAEPNRHFGDEIEFLPFAQRLQGQNGRTAVAHFPRTGYRNAHAPDAISAAMFLH